MSQNYRPNVAVLVTDGQGQVLLCSRLAAADIGKVQTVQGGIDEGETAKQAAVREVWEEIGLEPNQFQIVGASTVKYRYTWPQQVIDELAHTGYIGQEQQFFLIQVNPHIAFDLKKHHQEFSKVAWGSPAELVLGAWEGKRPGLQGALQEFGLLPQDFAS